MKKGVGETSVSVPGMLRRVLTRRSPTRIAGIPITIQVILDRFIGKKVMRESTCSMGSSLFN